MSGSSGNPVAKSRRWSTMRWMGRLRRSAARINARHRMDPVGYRHLVDSLYSSPASIIPGGIAGIICVYLCWRDTGLSIFLDLTYATTAIVALRVMSVVAYRRQAHEEQTYDETRWWDAVFFAGATAFSAVIGVTTYIALAHTDNPGAHVTTVASTIAFASGYVARNAGRPYFVCLQLIVFCAPLSAGLLSTADTTYHPIGYFAMFYVANNIAITFSVHRNLVALSEATKRSQRLASALKQRNITLDAALNNMSYGLAMFDENFRLAVSNGRFGELYEISPERQLPGTDLPTIGRDLVRHNVLSLDHVGAILNVCESVIADKTEGHCEVVTRSGKTLVVSAAPVDDGGVMLLTEDATDRKAAAARIERMARFDELTGLANRFQFETTLKEACVRLAMEGRSFAVFYMDLDHFKQINDNLGHAAGDLVLVETSRRLQAYTQPGDLVARFGGDEFLVIQFDVSPETATANGNRIVEAMARPFEIAGKSLYVSASVGVALAPEHGISSADLLRHADIALYRAKAAGRSTCVVFALEMARALAERHEIELDLRKAFDSNGLSLHYQPIIDLKTGKVRSFEALMRWQHPEKGMIPPGLFIPIAEQTGLIARLGEWAIRQACLDAANWPGNVTVAVNVSPLQFRDSRGLIDTVKEALAAARLAPGRLALEVTESLLIEDQRTTLDALRSLRRLGVKLSLDDFGSGYSSLAYLSTYPFSTVKIDRAFAKDVAVNANARSIVEAVCQLAKRLGMQVVVEGIETEDQRAMIETLGADRAQGYLFGRPSPVTSISALLKLAA